MLWLIVFFLIPLLIMLAYSFMPRGIYGGVDRGFTLEHYARFFDPLYLDVLQRTFLWSVACTVICLVLGYPVAYRDRPVGPLAAPAASPGGAAVLDQLPGPNLRHDLPAAGHRARSMTGCCGWV